MHTALIFFPRARIARGRKTLEDRHFEVFAACTYAEGLAWLDARPTLIFVSSGLLGNRFRSQVDDRFSTVVTCHNGLSEGPWLEATLEAIGRRMELDLRSGLDSISCGRYDDHPPRHFDD